MTGLTENRPLLWSLICTFILTFMFASESVPSLNKYFQLIPFPEESFRDFILVILMIDVVGSLLFDRLMKFIFAPQILVASLKGTTFRDVFGVLRTFGVIAWIMYSMLGSNEVWDEMMRMEEELALNATGNATETLAENATEVLETVAGAVYDEF